jgi:class 3 adenylate cyclase
MSDTKKGKGQHEASHDTIVPEPRVKATGTGVPLNSSVSKIDLGKVDLRNIDIGKVDLSKIDFGKVDLSHLQPLSFPAVSSLSTIPAIDFSKIKLPAFDPEFFNRFSSFSDEVAKLRKQVDSQARALKTEKLSGQTKEQQIAKLESTLDELHAKERIGFLLGRVNASAQRELLSSEAFRSLFIQERETNAVVLSVDIRRSTELMLKARRPQAFAEFVTTLCADMMRIITDCFGVFDKFTGDGVLAFFPEFYSGPDAPYYAVEAADRCHDSFREHYHRFRRSFTSVLTDIGLGIGLDYGAVHLVQIAGGLTVVGAPVVYACRLAGAPANTTLANQPAYEALSDTCASTCFIDETVLDIKHEGSMLAYQVRRNGRDYSPQQPSWLSSTVETKKID